MVIEKNPTMDEGKRRELKKEKKTPSAKVSTGAVGHQTPASYGIKRFPKLDSEDGGTSIISYA